MAASHSYPIPLTQELIDRLDFDNFFTLDEIMRGLPRPKTYSIWQGSKIHHIYLVEVRVDDRIQLRGNEDNRNKLRVLFNRGIPSIIDYSLGDLKLKKIEVVLPDSIAYQSSVKAKLHQDRIRFFVDNEIQLGEFMSIMSYIPGMQPLYEKYIDSKDNEVMPCKGSDDYFTINRDANYALYQNEEEKYSIVENILAGYIVMLMMIKNIPSTNLNHLHEFVKKRLGALSFHIGSSASGIGYETVLNRFNEEELFILNEKITFFPQFKKAVFELVCNASTKELAHMKAIFENSSMTIFTLISEFCFTPEPTLLHIQPSVVRDYLKWRTAYKKVKDEYGDKWKFYKLLNPTGVDTCCKQYDSLACAAVSWALNQEKYANLKKMKGIRSSERFRRLAAQKLPPHLVMQNHGTLEAGCQNNPNTAPHDENASGSN